MTIWQELNNLQRIKLKRVQRVMREGSPKYHYDVAGGIAAGAYVDISIENTFPQAQKYAPLDSCLVINNDTVPISLTFNSRTLIIIPAGVIRKLSQDEIPAFYGIRITNQDAANNTTANMIDIEFWRAPETADSAARRAV